MPCLARRAESVMPTIEEPMIRTGASTTGVFPNIVLRAIFFKSPLRESWTRKSHGKGLQNGERAKSRIKQNETSPSDTRNRIVLAGSSSAELHRSSGVHVVVHEGPSEAIHCDRRSSPCIVILRLLDLSCTLSSMCRWCPQAVGMRAQLIPEQAQLELEDRRICDATVR